MHDAPGGPPATSSALSLQVDAATRELRASYEPVEGQPGPDREALQQLLVARQLDAALIDDDALQAFLQACQAGRVDGHPIGRCEDARVQLMLSADRMQAWLTLEPPQGGAPASLARLQRALSEQGVVFGVRDDALNEALQRGHCSHALVAEGREPEPGVPARFESLLGDARRRGDDDNSGSVNYRELGALRLVEPGALLMRRHPAQPGQPGRDLLGQRVEPRPVPDLPFDAVPGATTAPHDSNLLVATVAGLPSVGPRGVSVNPHVEVANVDLASGNIRFQGSVRVRGDVRAGMTVQVSGDVLVDGTVEAAEIVAGGHLLVAGGIIGRAEHGQAATTARVRVKGDVQARFIEHADVEAGGQLRTEAGLRDSRVLAGDAVLVGGNGSIVGGSTAAHRRICAPTLGSAWHDPTELQVGVNPFIDARLTELRAERERREAERSKVQQLLAFLATQPAQAALREKAEATLHSCEQALAGLSDESAALVAELALSDSAVIEAQRKLHGGVHLHVGASQLKVLEDRGPTRAMREDARIVFD